MTDYKELKNKVDREVDFLHEYTPWGGEYEKCRGCYNNINGDHCHLIKHGLPWECPYFADSYDCEEIHASDYLELLLFADQVLNRKAFVLNGKKYKLTEVE